MDNLFSAEFDEFGNVVLRGGQTVLNFHSAGSCAGDVCPVHNPSDHKYRCLPLFFNSVNMTRELLDGSHLPDPDDYLFNKTGKAILRTQQNV